MQLRLPFSNWTKVAAVLLLGGALAWTIKLGVIISTNGQIIDTGAAAFFMKVGLPMLVIGTTGIGTRLSVRWHLFLRILAVLLSPVIVAGLLILIGMVINPLFKNSSIWYAEQEAPIAVAVVVCMTIGFVLYRNSKPVTR